MQLALTQDEAAFRDELRTFYKTKIPADIRERTRSGEGLDRGQCDRGVHALVGTVQWDEHVLVAAARGPQRHHSTPHSDSVGLAAEITPGQPHRRARRRWRR